MQQLVDQFDLKSKFETDELKHKLKMAGLRGQAPLYAFVFFRMIMPPIVLAMALVYLFVINPELKYPMIVKLMMAFAGGFLGFYLPNMFLENMIQRRQQSLKDAFPDALDMLLICVQSGMSIEAAFGKVAKEIGNQSLELAEEFLADDSRTVLPAGSSSGLREPWHANRSAGHQVGGHRAGAVGALWYAGRPGATRDG